MKRFIAFLKENKASAIAVFAVIIIMVIFMAMSITCPIKYLTGISCPGCGLTRAFLSVLRLDFSSAFYYNPTWLSLAISALLILVLRIKHKSRASNIVFILFVFTVFAVYFYRMLVGNNDIVIFSPRKGALFALLFN